MFLTLDEIVKKSYVIILVLKGAGSSWKTPKDELNVSDKNRFIINWLLIVTVRKAL